MGGHVVIGRENDVLEACITNPQAIWWLVVYIEDGKLKYRYIISSSSQQRPLLINLVKELKRNGLQHLIFAIWHGRYRTDVFLVNADTLIKVLGNDGGK